MEWLDMCWCFEGDNVSAEDRNTRFNKFFVYKNTNNEEDML